MISCAANSGPLSVVIDLIGSSLSRMSRTTAYARCPGLMPFDFQYGRTPVINAFSIRITPSLTRNRAY